MMWRSCAGCFWKWVLPMDEKRIGLIAILVENERQSAGRVNEILSEFAGSIVARLGVPDVQHDLAVIAVVVRLGTDALGALSGRLGNLPGVSVKSLLTNKSYPA